MKKIIVAVVSLVIASFLAGWGFSSLRYNREIERYNAEKRELLQKALVEKAEIERKNRERVSEIEQDNEKKLKTEKAKYEKQIADIRKNFKPSGTVAVAGVCDKGSRSGNSMSGAGEGSREIICYERAELQGKIIGTLAIGHECDRLALDYNALLEISK